MSDTPLLSIVIPTRNREFYTEHAIRSILSLPGNSFEIVVQDNSDNNTLETFVRNGNYGSRVTYFSDRRKLSMNENFELAVARARGRYICLLGDDDGVASEILDGVAWAEAQNADVLIANSSSCFRWPDLTMRYHRNGFSGTLSIPPFSGDVSFPSAQTALEACARHAGQAFGNLPQVYHGIVRRSALEAVRNRTGYFFPGVSPDMAAAVAVASMSPRIVKVDYPLVLPGNGGRSAAGSGARKQHWGRLEDQSHLSSDYVKNWSRQVPRFYAGSTMWAEAFCSAALAAGRSDLIERFNYARLHAYCLALEPQYARETVASFRRHLRTQRQSFREIREFLRAYASIWCLRAKFLVVNATRRKMLSGVTVLTGIENIEQAMRSLSEYLTSHQLSFQKAVNRAQS